VIWSLVPDYLNLFKTRAILSIIAARQINRASILVVIVFADFVVGYAIFSLTFGPIILPFLGENPLWVEILFLWPTTIFHLISLATCHHIFECDCASVLGRNGAIDLALALCCSDVDSATCDT
jgi:hypothetical protein